jgi:hypothetical protein
MIRTLRLSALALAVSLALPLAARADALNLPSLPPSTDNFGFSSGEKGLNFGIPSGGGPTIGFSYLLNSRAALEVNLGLGFTLTSPTDFAFSIELGYRAYLGRVGERLYPFFQPGFFLGRSGGVESIAFEGGVGVEYFLLDHFTVAGATGLAFSVGNLGGNSASVRLATGTTALYANFYF